jgi:heat shock protein 4
MSCIGIDIGQQNAVVAIARRGGIDVLTNEVSKRLTSCMVGFSGKERKLGEQALSGITSNLKNTITGMKAIMGKKFHSDDIQLEMDLVGYRMVDVAGKVGLPVNYCDEEVMLTPERAMAMLMKCMQGIAELDQGSPVTDVVVSVPSYFTDAERQSMLAASQIAGLNCLRLMNDSTAAALSYGIYKTDLPADKATYVAFVDCGAMDTTISIVSFVKGKLTVLASASDRHLGGRDFDMILAEHFAAEWKEKHKIDAKTNKKAMYRLVTAAEKTKKILSANPQAPINIECFMDDIDVKGNMEREEMLTVAAPLLVKLDGIMQEAVEASGVSKEDIGSVEVFGGSCRIPARRCLPWLRRCW